MKNHYYEKIRREFKSAPPTKAQFLNKICIYHSFSEIGPSGLTCWSDFGFIVNSYYINVEWIHPRIAFQSVVRRQANKQVMVLFNDYHFESIMNEVEPVYQKLGNSRKKITSWQSLPSKNNSIDLASALKIAEEKAFKETDIIIKPSVSVKWWKDGKSVSLCAPFEVRSAEDVAALVIILKRILKHEIDIDEAFNKYRYGRLNWLEEFPAEAHSDKSL